MAQLKSLATQSLAKPVDWILDIIGDEDIEMYIDEDQDPLDIFERSRNPDDIILATGRLVKQFLEGGKTYGKQVIAFFNHLSEFRWIQLIRMRPDVACDCVSLFDLLEFPPDAFVLETVAPVLVLNKTAVHTFASVWIEHNWKLSMVVVFIIQSSPIAWKFLIPLHATNKNKNTSRFILDEIALIQDKEKQKLYYALLSSNGSCLQHLIDLDTMNADGIASTFATINGYQQWDTVLSNPAVGPLIDYALDHFWLMTPGFYSRRSLREWIIVRLNTNPNSYQYITQADVLEEKVSSSFFSTLGSIPLIKSLVMLDVSDPNRYINDNIIDGLISMAMVDDKEMALSAIDVIDNGLRFEELKERHWNALAEGPHGQAFIKRKLIALDKRDMLLNILINANLVPYISIDYEDIDGQEVEFLNILNLTPETAQNIKYHSNIFLDLCENARYIEYADWNILVQSDIGLDIAIDNLDCIIKEGSLPFLLKSKYLSTDDLKHLCLETNLLEYCTDEELIALLGREDVYEPKLKAIVDTKQALCSELLEVWFEPDRLVRVSNSHGLDMRAYLQTVG